MIIGVPRETKANERRVGLVPSSVLELERAGHDVVVESGAGEAIGASDDDYIAVGAAIAADGPAVFDRAEMIIKVKEPGPDERALLRPHHILFTYLHLAPDPEQTKDLLDSGATCIAYETVTDDRGRLPLLAPMSKVAGKMAVQAGAHHLEYVHGGAGMLLGGVPGVPGAHVVVIGGGVVGENATEIAVGMGADVTVLDRTDEVLDRLAKRFGPAVRTVHANATTTREAVLAADLVVGAVLVRGARAPRLVTAEMVTEMKPRTVVVDVAIDQGGCFETSRPTTHEDPVYVVDDVVHYCVANMPGVVPRTSTYALNNVTLPFVITLATDGVRAAVQFDAHLRNGVNIVGGKVTEPAVAEALGYDFFEPLSALSAA